MNIIMHMNAAIIDSEFVLCCIRVLHVFILREREHVLIYSGCIDVVPLIFQDFPYGGGGV